MQSHRFATTSILLALAGLLVTAGCSDGSGTDDGGETSSCTPGRSTGCTCPSGDEGAQVCQSDGSWGPCTCGSDLDDGGTGDVTPDGGTDEGDSSGSEEDASGADGGGGDAGGESGRATVCCEFSDLDQKETASCRGMQFDRVVNIVDDLGADPDGEEPIDTILEEEISDGTLVVFPDGTYLSGGADLGGSDIGLVAADGANPTIVPAAPTSEIGETLWSYGDSGGLLMQGLDFDYTEEGVGNRLNITPDGPFSICDIDLLGAFPDDTKGFRVDVRAEDAEGLLQDAVMTGGPEESTFDWNGIYVGSEHAGTVTIKNCVVANGSNNGLYASSPGADDGGNGPVRVIGGLYKNNNIAGVRIGSSGSVVRGVDVVVDSQVPEFNGRNARGVRIRDRRGQIVEDLDIVYTEDATTGSGAVSLHNEAGGATIRDVRIEMSADDMPAIRGKSPEVDGDLGATIENVSVTGSAAGGAAFEIADRPETVIRDSCIQQTGDDRDGIELSNSSNSEVSDTSIDVTGTDIVDDGSDVSTTNISESADCATPSVRSLP